MTTREAWRAITLRLIETGATVTTMESCTAGEIASLITDTEGASAILKGAFVTYSNEAKVMQGVPQAVIARYGVYSAETAAAMASACRRAYKADIGIGVTGTMGNPDPANPGSVPGEVFFAIETNAGTAARRVEIPPQPTRHAWKLAAAQAISNALAPLIGITPP